MLYRTRPLVFLEADLVLAFSPKSACTHVLAWYLSTHGLLDEALAHHPFVHRYRIERLMPSARHSARVAAVRARGGRGFTLLRVTRDPVKRFVSCFRHACRHPFLAPLLRARLGLDQRAQGLSLTDFGRALEGLRLTAPTTVNPHVTTQWHPVQELAFDRVITLNIDETPLEAGLEALEREFGLPPADPAAVARAAHASRYAEEAPHEGPEPLETLRFPLGGRHGFPRRQLQEHPLTLRLARSLHGIDFGRVGTADSRGRLFPPPGGAARP